MQKLQSRKWKNSIIEKFQVAEELRMEEEFCDITLESFDKKQVKAHKVILITGSNYFRNLFSSGMRESFEQCIQYKQIKGEILEKVISFIYTGKLEVIDLSKIEEIAACANYFQLDELIEECVDLLSRFINDDNCLRYWRLAGECFQKNFEKSCIFHIFTSSSHFFENETFFNQLEKHEIKILLKDARLNWTEEMKFDKILNWSKSKVSANERYEDLLFSVIKVINFGLINKEFVLSKILETDDILENKNIRRRIMESFEGVHNRSTLSSGGVASERKLVAIICNEMKTISNEGLINSLQRKEDHLWDVEHCVFNNSLFICGGRNKVFEDVGRNSCEYFIPSKMEWRDLPWMQNQRFGHTCILHENFIYVCGGNNNDTILSDVEIFDLNQEQWIDGPDMKNSREKFGMAVANRSLYAVGGYGSKNIQMLDPRINEWIGVHGGFQNEDLTRCISIESNIFCFRRDKPWIFDTKMNALREWEGSRNYVPVKKFSGLRVCTLDDHFYFIHHYYLRESICLDFYKYDFQGNLFCSKLKAFHLRPFGPFGAFAPLNF